MSDTASPQITNILKKSLLWAIDSRNFLIILLLTIGMLPALAVYGGYFISSDGTLQQLPFIYEFKRMISTGAPWWSWNTFIGDDYLVSHSYYTVFNVFAWINALLPNEYIRLGFTLIIYVKFLILGWVTEVYLRKMGFERPLSLIGCLLFVFSTWIICNQIYYFFVEPVIMAMVLLICIENFLSGKRLSGFYIIVTVAVTALMNFYFTPSILLFGALYFICRLWSMVNEGPKRFLTLAKAVAFVFIGLIIAAFALIPETIFLSSSHRAALTTEFSLNNILNRFLTLFFPVFIEGPSPFYLAYCKWFSNQSTIVLFGCLPAIIYVAKNWKSWLSIYLIICTVVFITPLNGIPLLFTAFEYSRWAFFLSLGLVLATLYYIRDVRTIKRSYLMYYTIFVASLYVLFGCSRWYIVFFRSHEPFGHQQYQLLMYVVLLALNLSLLWCLARKDMLRHQGRLMLGLVMICIAVQFVSFTLTRCDYSPMSSPFYRNASRYLVIDPMPYSEDDEFVSRTDFRTSNPNFFLYSNMATLTNTPSVQSYSSMKNPQQADLFDLTADENKVSIQLFSPVNHRTSFDALVSVSRVIDFNDPDCFESKVDNIVWEKDTLDYSVYKFGYYIPMGFAYDNYILADDVRERINPQSVVEVDFPLALLNTIAIESDDEAELSKYLKKGEIKTDLDIDSVVAQRRAVVCNSFSGDTKGFTATINSDTDRVVFFSVPWNEGFTATIDGKKTKIYKANLALSAVVVPQGLHTIRFDYFPPHLIEGLWVSLVGLILALIVLIVEIRDKQRQ